MTFYSPAFGEFSELYILTDVTRYHPKPSSFIVLLDGWEEAETLLD